MGATPAPDCDSCPGICSAATSRGGPLATAGTANETILTEPAIREGGEKASPSVSIFSRAPLCPNTCRHCRNKPCDIATDHDDHICYNCEQRLLFPERIPKWETQKLPPSSNTRRFTRMHTSTFSLLGAFLSLPYTYPFPPSSSLPSTPLVTSVYSMALRHSHRNFPCDLSLQVYTQYPLREVFLMASLLPACVCTLLITFWFNS